jgi:hypothetical protein
MSIEGKISLTRKSTGVISIKITKSPSFIDFLEIELTPETLGLILTGLSFQDCTLIERVKKG